MKRKTGQVLCGLLAMVLCGMVICAVVAAADDLQAETGMILVAREGLPDLRFRDAVILLIQHDKQGSAGLIINRPSRLALTALFPEQSALIGERRVLSYGGPVAAKELLALVGTSSSPPQPARQVLEDLFVTGPGELVDWLSGQPDDVRFRVFAGYAGWGEGQLAAELARGDWRLLSIDTARLFNADHADLWTQLKAGRPL